MVDARDGLSAYGEHRCGDRRRTGPAGDNVVVPFASANRDETVFHAPDRFDCERSGVAHVGFGFGLHACLGGQLARLQTERVLLALLSRYPVWEVQTEDVRWQSESLILRGPAALRCRFGSAHLL